MSESKNESAQQELKLTIAKILGIPVTNDWDIYDSIPKKNLYLVHYKPSANVNKYGWIQGIVVDIKNECIVCKSSHSDVLEKDKLIIKNDTLILEDKNNSEILSSEKYRIYQGIEGLAIRVFRHEGVTYLSTHKRIEVRNYKSRWGNSILFSEMIKQLPFPDPDSIFSGSSTDEQKSSETEYDIESDTSPIVYIFIITHPDILNVSRDYVKRGYVSYLGYNLMNKKNVSTNNINVEINTFESLATYDLSEAKKSNKVYIPKEMTLEEANNHLKYGFYPKYENIEDARCGYGENLMIVPVISDTESRCLPFNIYEVASPAYTWRKSIRGDNSSLYGRFFELSENARINVKSDSLLEYKRRFPLYNMYNIESVKHMIHGGKRLMKWGQDATKDYILDTYKDRIYNIWVCYMMSCPVHRQNEIVDMYDSYRNDMEYTVSILNTMYLNESYKNNTHSHNKNITKIIEKAIFNKSTQEYNKHELKQYISDKVEVEVDTKKDDNIILNTIKKEVYSLEGSTLYSLYKYLFQYKNIIS
uniref:RNA ligase with polynucleotide kinase domain n=1 Tax=Pithovirus LCPAC101 TaxID=2506586 RepID=A0A481Z3Z7_9VIRU|nr:MAG: RNA ligase with polynucleotide kinase domain [Pithovirus LCPAC101]